MPEENLQNYSLPEQEIVIQDPLKTSFEKSPGHGEVIGGNLPFRGWLWKKTRKWLIILLVLITGVVGGYFVLDSYFPQYAKYVQPYLGPVLDPINNRVNSIISTLPIIGGAPYKSEDIFKAFEKTVLMDSAKYKAGIYIETQDKESGIKPLVVKIPKGEIPDDLKNGIIFYDYSSGIKSGEIKNDTAIVVDLSELKSIMNAKATDNAKLELVSSILSELGLYYGKNLKDPATLAELKDVSSSTYSTYGYDKWGSLEGKYYTYTAAPDLKSFKLAITLDSPQSVEALKRGLDTYKKDSYLGTKFKEDSITFDGNKVIFNERSVGFAYNLTYISLGNTSVAEQVASLFSDGSSGGYLSYIPGRFKLNLNIGGIMQSKDSKSFYIQLGGKADFEDLVVEADFEFTNVDKESFLKINKFPSIFMDISKVREEWIKLPTASKSSDSTYSDSDFYSEYATSIQEGIIDYREKSDRNFEQMRKLASVAEKERIITAEPPVKEKINDKTAYKYPVTIDENKLASFYEKAAAELKEFGDEALIKDNELTRLFFNSNGLKEIIKYLKDTSDFNVWVDASGYIVKYQYDIKYVPYVSSESQAASNKQFYISASVELSDINKNLEVEKPGKYIEWKEAVSKLFGVLEEQLDDARGKARDARRIADVSQLRTAAELYFDDNNGSYPTSLSIANLKAYFSSVDVPKDPVTGKEYNYAYYPASKPTKYHIWIQLEEENQASLRSDSDINSKIWIGNSIDASFPNTEACAEPFGDGTAVDCIYDLGQK